MEFADLGFKVTVAYEDLSDVWPYISRALKARLPLRNVTLTNKLGGTVSVDTIPVRVVPISNPSVQRLQQYCNSALSWFRQPVASLVLISCADAEEFKRNFRLQLRAMIDSEARYPLGPEPVFIYVTPPSVENDPKGTAKVVDAMRRELGTRRRERIARIDLPLDGSDEGAADPQGIDDLVTCLKLAIAASMDSRIAAYGEVIKQQLTGLQAGAPGASFTDLFLVKDSVAVMMESVGLVEDAVREYYELEVAYNQIEGMKQRGESPRRKSLEGAASPEQPNAGDAAVPFCGIPKLDVDEAAGIWAGWRACRLALQEPKVSNIGDGGIEMVPPLTVRQALFSSQCRVLLKLRRHRDVLERGVAFLQQSYSALAVQEEAVAGPSLLKEVWTFAGCVSLAAAVASRHAENWGEGGAESPLKSVFPDKATFLKGVLDEASDAEQPGGSSDFWRLGTLPQPQATSPRDEQSQNASSAVYCLLGQLYGMARQQLEVLGAASGLSPPSFHPDLWTAASKAPKKSSPGVLIRSSPAVEDAVTPRRSAQGARSVSPSKTSLDMNSARSPFYSGGGFAGVETGEEVTSLSVTLPKEGSDFLQEGMQNVDLTTAAGGSTTPRPSSSGPLAAAAYQIQNGTPPGEGGQGDAGLTVSTSAAQHGVELAPVFSSDIVGSTPSRLRRSVTSTSHASTRDPESAESTPRSMSAASTTAPSTAAPSTPTRLPGAAPGVSPDATGAAAAAAQGDGGGGGASMRALERVIDALFTGEGHSLRHSSEDSYETATASAEQHVGKIWKPVHWRLRRALASKAAFADLWQALTAAAATCFEEGGHRRHAFICRSEVADCLAASGKIEEAAEMYELQCRFALSEGWTMLAATTLPKLAACQAAVSDPGLAFTATALLVLGSKEDSSTFSVQHTAAAFALLHRAAEHPNPALHLKQPLLFPRPGHPLSSLSLHFDPEILDLSTLLVAQPIKGSYSRFYRRNDHVGLPVLCATGPDAAVGHVKGTHVKCAVGDVAVITIKVINHLPSSVTVRDLQLSLAGMQEIMAIASPRSGSPSHNPFRPSMQNMPLNPRSTALSVGNSTPHQGLSHPSTATAAAAAAAVKAGHSSSPFYRQDSFADEGPRFVAEWQDTEDLQCCLVGISSEQEVKRGSTNKQKNESKATKTNADSFTSPGLLTPLTGPIELLQGANVLRFMAAPVKKGLYRPVRVTGGLSNLQISFAVENTVADVDPYNSAKHPFFSLPSESYVPEDAVVLEVEPLLPRVILEAATALGGGCVVAGQGQWLGLHIAAGRDRLEDTILDITWPTPPSSNDIARKMSGLMGVPGSPLPHSISLSSAGSDAAPGGIDPSIPLLAPKHDLALISRSAASGAWEQTDLISQAAKPQSGHDAVWAEESHQEFSIPALASDEDDDISKKSSATVWWWVEAGTFAVPSEQIKVAAPGTAPQPPPQVASLYSGNTLPSTSLSPVVEGYAGIDDSLVRSPEQSVLDLPVSLQYLCGCRRSFSKVLQIPVQHPFVVGTSATEVSTGNIVAHFQVSSLLPYATTLTAVTLLPQPGVVLERDLTAELGLLPTTLPAHGSFSLSFILGLDQNVASSDRAAAQLRLQQAAKLQPSSLQLSYAVDVQEVCGVEVPAPRAAHAVGHAGHRTTVHGESTHWLSTSTQKISQQGSTTTPQEESTLLSIRLPSTASLQRLQGKGGSGSRPSSARSKYQSCSFTHRCAFELAPLEQTAPGAVIMVQLLGPFVAVAGQPVSLCWRLERAGAADVAPQGKLAAAGRGKESKAPSQPLRIQFECIPQGNSWRPAGRRGGSVPIESFDGALATIEATWVPLVTGTLPVPSLKLMDCAYQECFDVGSGGANYLIVSPPPQ